MCYKPKGSSPNSSRKIVRHTNSLEIPLKQINFNSSTSSTSQAIHASTEEDLALFFDDKTEVSIFLNNMKDEVSFGIKEVESYRITRDNSIILKLKPRFSKFVIIYIYMYIYIYYFYFFILFIFLKNKINTNL